MPFRAASLAKQSKERADAKSCRQNEYESYSTTKSSRESHSKTTYFNFRDLKKLVHEQFDHYLLNDLPAFKDKSPSTEIVAQTIYHIIQKELNQRENQPKCVQVYLRETPSSYVVYRPKEDQV